MARPRRSRLSWYRMFWSDFDGGTKLFNCAETGQYVRLLHLQCDSGERQSIPSDAKALSRVLGESPSERVLGKFDLIAPDRLRNQRLASEFEGARTEYEGKSRRTERADTAKKRRTKRADTTPEPEPEPEPDRTDTGTAPPPPPAPVPDAPEEVEISEAATDNPEEGAQDPPPPADPPKPKPVEAEIVQDPNTTKLTKSELKKDETGWHLGKAYAEAVEDWCTRFDGGMLPYGRAGNALRPWIRRQCRERKISERDFWEKLGRPAWRNYVTHANPDYCTINGFVAKPFQTPGDGKAQQQEIKARVTASVLDDWVPPEERA